MRGVRIKNHTCISSSIIGLHSTVGKWARVENMTVLGEDVHVGDEIYSNGGVILPHKEIKYSILKPEIVIDVLNDCGDGENISEGSNVADIVKVLKLVEEGKEELYPGCKNFSKLSFMIRYLHNGVKTKFTRYVRYFETGNGVDDITCIFPKMGHPVGSKKKKGKTIILDDDTMRKAHRYALFNCGDEEVEKYISEHQTLTDNLRGSKWARAQNHSKDFISWFEKKVMTEGASDDI
ncbi:hypothetical protein Dimus_023001 [Dionaea muscipula]